MIEESDEVRLQIVIDAADIYHRATSILGCSDAILSAAVLEVRNIRRSAELLGETERMDQVSWLAFREASENLKRVSQPEDEAP